MQDYVANRWVKIGVVLVVLGWGPLLAIVALDSIHLWPDPNPNPIGAGLLFFFTFWPAVICLGVGASQVARRRKHASLDVSPRPVACEGAPTGKSSSGSAILSCAPPPDGRTARAANDARNDAKAA